jgi:NADP-dependent 3-hydroxy acid dehydrogenase YdfG
MGSSLEGTVALVTGASSGIGAATARHLTDNGATVALVARRKDRLDTVVTDIERSGGTAFAVEADIGDRTQAEGSVAPAVKQAGQVDILINNAGLMLLARSSAPMSMTGTGSPSTSRACCTPPEPLFHICCTPPKTDRVRSPT